MKKVYIYLSIALTTLLIAGFWGFKHFRNYDNIGNAIDSLHGVKVYCNGPIANVEGRNLTKDGYNLGLKYQCVEFVKRYYYEHYGHRMPDSYGHAKDYFNPSVKDGAINSKRDLVQYTNPSKSKPHIGDLMIYSGHLGNPYGHVSIVAVVEKESIEIIQQNPGLDASTRARYTVTSVNRLWKVENNRILGWLRKK